MYNNFTLSINNKGNLFPTKIICDGEDYNINSDFRTILKVLRLNEDQEIFPQQKCLMMLKWFYTNKYPNDLQKGIESLFGFICNNPIDDDESKKPPQYDFEYDAEEIYISFLKDYDIGLVEIDFLHWYKFRTMLRNLSEESPLMQRIRLRFLDLKDYKGKRRAELSEAKKKVQIPEKINKKDKEAKDNLFKRLQN